MKVVVPTILMVLCVSLFAGCSTSDPSEVEIRGAIARKEASYRPLETALIGRKGAAQAAAMRGTTKVLRKIGCKRSDGLISGSLPGAVTCGVEVEITRVFFGEGKTERGTTSYTLTRSAEDKRWSVWP